MSAYVTRVTVESWPTADGRKWPRFVSFDDVCDWEEHEWLKALLDEDGLDEFWAGDDDAGNPIGYILPAPQRRHWFSAKAAQEWARRARLLGAVVKVETSKRVEWVSES